MFYLKKIGISSQPPNFQTFKRFNSHYSLISIFSTLTISFLTFQCGLDIEDSTPPSAPVWVEKSLPEEWPERGIDAHESGGLLLEWKPNSLDEYIIVYHIFRATWFEMKDSIGQFKLIQQLEANELSETQYIDTKATFGEIFHYKIRSEDGAGNRSEFSNSISYSLMPPIESEMMRPNGLNDQIGPDRKLFWYNFYLTTTENYILTIKDENDDFLIRVVLLPRNYFGEEEYWQLPESLTLEPGSNYKWRIDTGGRYSDGFETSASESTWANFLF